MANFIFGNWILICNNLSNPNSCGNFFIERFRILIGFYGNGFGIRCADFGAIPHSQKKQFTCTLLLVWRACISLVASVLQGVASEKLPGTGNIIIWQKRKEVKYLKLPMYQAFLLHYLKYCNCIPLLYPRISLCIERFCIIII